MPLDLDWRALFGLLLLLPAWLWIVKRRVGRDRPTLGFSCLNDMNIPQPSWRSRWHLLPRRFHFAGLVLFAAAFLEPRIPFHQEREADSSPKPPTETRKLELPTEGVAVYLVLDHSGSMAREVSLVDKEGVVHNMRRLDLLKAVTEEFIEGSPQLELRGRPDDLIGLITFARVPEVRSPLTLDHEALIRVLKTLEVVDTRERDGTAIGYALFKTVNIILGTRHFSEDLNKKGKPAYNIKSQAVILVTDGFEDPNALDQGHPLRTKSLYDAAQYAADNHVAVYIINVEPAFARPENTGYRKKFTEAAEKTGGAFFVMTEKSPLQEIYKEIDKLEKGKLPVGRAIEAEVTQRAGEDKQEPPVNWHSLAGICTLLGIGALAVASLLETTLLRRAP